MTKSINFFITICLILFFSCNDPDEQPNILGVIKGETLTLRGEEYKSLYRKIHTVHQVYSLDYSGIKHVFELNKDYVVSSEGLIARTPHSSIPDFNEYKVDFNEDGSFTFRSEPRNPPLTIPYLVYINYSFEIQNSLITPDSNNVLGKIKGKNTVKIASLGTSITAAAHTYNNYYHSSSIDNYVNCLGRFLHDFYGIEVVIHNYGKENSTIDVFNSFEEIQKNAPDIVFIEYGINDKLGAMWFNNAPLFEENLNAVVERIQSIQCIPILIGFFQQNKMWDLEYPQSTEYYNKIIEKVAKKNNCLYVNIQEAFEELDTNKFLDDYTGDWMHHPTEFGHRLYVKKILPHFIEDPYTDDFLFTKLNITF